MVAPRSRNPLFNRVPDYQRPQQGTRVNAVPPTWYMPGEWHNSTRLPSGTLGQSGSAQNPLRRPADSGVPGTGYDQWQPQPRYWVEWQRIRYQAPRHLKPPSPQGLISPGNPVASQSAAS